MKYLLALTVLIQLASCKTPDIYQTNNPKCNPVIAHRGAFKKNRLPENSIASLKEAIKLGCYGSEFDVRMTADDSLVINHDPHYNQLSIEKTNYRDLLQFALPNGEKIPTLREYVLAGLKRNKTTKLICEIKPSAISKQRGKEIAEKAVLLFHQLSAIKRAVFISFDYEILKHIRLISPGAVTQYLNGDVSPEQLKNDGIAGADYHFSVFKKKPEWIQAAKDLGVALNAWTVNDENDIDWLLANKFQFITTNEPELLFERIKKAPAMNGWKLFWSDEFNYSGLPDSTKWKHDVGGHGWGNAELQYYTGSDTTNTFVSDGILHIRAIQKTVGTNKYTSGKLVTKERQLFKYGKVEVRAKLPSGRGIWPAIWMLGSDIDSIGWPDCGEIDIMEHVGFNPDSVFGSIHTKSFHHSISTQKTKGKLLLNPYTEFHTYAVDWSPEKIVFSMDGEAYFEFANLHHTKAEWPFDQPFYLILNVAVGGSWGGQKGVDNSIFPAEMLVDYVRVYQ